VLPVGSSSYELPLSFRVSHNQNLLRFSRLLEHPKVIFWLSSQSISREVFSLITYQVQRIDLTEGFPSPSLCSVFRFSQPLDGLFPTVPLQPCFMPLPFSGFSFQSPVQHPPAQTLLFGCSLHAVFRKP
jgi:hypothetical protein